MTEKVTKKRPKKKYEFFAKRLTELIDEKKKDTGMTQEDIAEKIGVSTPNSISDWRRGHSFPSEDNLSKLCEFLDVPVEVFYPSTHDEKYKYDTAFATDLGRGKLSEFCDEIDLDPRFLFVVRELMGSNFDTMFPTYTPIHLNPTYLMDGLFYTRRDRSMWSKLAEMDEDVRFYQYEIDVVEEGTQTKRLIPFTKQDLRFLKRLQDDVTDYIEFLMMKCANDRQREVDEANRRSEVKTVGGGTSHKPLPAEVLNQIDRDCNEYTDDEKEGK